MKMKDHVWKIIAVVAVIAIGGSMVYSNSVANQANEGIAFEAHYRGNPDAKVTLTEYSDFQCPACGQFAPVVDEVVAGYGDAIRLEYKHFPLVSIHSFAIPAAKAAEAAGQQGKFFEMHDKLFENQQVWSNSAAPQVFFTTYAKELDLDLDLFKKHMKASLIADKIQDEFAEARALGLNSTPTFFLNGERMQFTTFEEFTSQLENAVGKVNPELIDKESSGQESHEVEGVSEPEVRFGF
jgi:protein-disulfide isomerase